MTEDRLHRRWGAGQEVLSAVAVTVAGFRLLAVASREPGTRLRRSLRRAGHALVAAGTGKTAADFSPATAMLTEIRRLERLHQRELPPLVMTTLADLHTTLTAAQRDDARDCSDACHDLLWWIDRAGVPCDPGVRFVVELVATGVAPATAGDAWAALEP